MAPLTVNITREAWSDYFCLELDNGHSEELEPEDARSWFRVRGADMEVVDKALDHCWNFYRSNVEISNPRSPVSTSKLNPKLE